MVYRSLFLPLARTTHTHTHTHTHSFSLDFSFSRRETRNRRRRVSERLARCHRHFWNPERGKFRNFSLSLSIRCRISSVKESQTAEVKLGEERRGRAVTRWNETRERTVSVGVSRDGESRWCGARARVSTRELARPRSLSSMSRRPFPPRVCV